jgi:hypothetical protein
VPRTQPAFSVVCQEPYRSQQLTPLDRLSFVQPVRLAQIDGAKVGTAQRKGHQRHGSQRMQ